MTQWSNEWHAVMAWMPQPAWLLLPTLCSPHWPRSTRYLMVTLGLFSVFTHFAILSFTYLPNEWHKEKEGMSRCLFCVHKTSQWILKCIIASHFNSLQTASNKKCFCIAQPSEYFPSKLETQTETKTEIIPQAEQIVGLPWVKNIFLL